MLRSSSTHPKFLMCIFLSAYRSLSLLFNLRNQIDLVAEPNSFGFFKFFIIDAAGVSNFIFQLTTTHNNFPGRAFSTRSFVKYQLIKSICQFYANLCAARHQPTRSVDWRPFSTINKYKNLQIHWFFADKFGISAKILIRMVLFFETKDRTNLKSVDALWKIQCKNGTLLKVKFDPNIWLA